MKKIIELTPEWVLNEFSHSLYADGMGIISVYTHCAANATWITKALDTLSIPYKAMEDSELQSFFFEFKIEDIQEECPILCKKLKDINNNNKNYNEISKN